MAIVHFRGILIKWLFPLALAAGVYGCQYVMTDLTLSRSDDEEQSYAPSQDLEFDIDLSAQASPISPWIYGSNFHTYDFNAVPFTLARTGGNRWTAYNWENNASNAGSDWYYWNDGYLSSSNEPGIAVTGRIGQMFTYGAAALITVPICGYVSKDKDQTNVMDETDLATRLNDRFLINKAFKGSAFSLTPDTSDGYVYQDEFVNLLMNQFPDHPLPIMYCLDNEPDIWHETHKEIHPEQPRYEEVADKNIEFARAIKSVDDDAVTLGFVSYGFNGYLNLQGDEAGESAHGDFIGYFLKRAGQAETTYGKRLIDVLDVHWYPEAKGDGVRIISDSVKTSGIFEARMQAPRTLWDSGYTEDSWIGQWFSDYLPLIPWLKGQVASEYPGTGLAISEYYYGGVDHISGAIAQADVLGIFGREGIFAATIWPSGSDPEENFIEAAFNMYLNYDGNGSGFGKLSFPAETSDKTTTSVYASADSADPNKLVIVAINKYAGVSNVRISINGGDFSSAKCYRLSGTGPADDMKIRKETLTEQQVSGGEYRYSMPAYSVTTIELTR